MLRSLVPASRLRSRIAAGVALLTVATVATGVGTLAPAAATSSGTSPFSCTDVYVVGSGGQISKVDPVTGSAASNGTFGVDATNALALPPGGGRYAYAFARGDNKVLRFDATTGAVSAVSAPDNSTAAGVVAGAINPANGLYYYASSSSGTWAVFAYDIAAGRAIGQVATLSGSALQGNGDMAFDEQGTLYLVTNSSENNASAAGTLARVDGRLPSTASTATLPVVALASTPSGYGSYNSIAFDVTGLLVIGTGGGNLLRVTPSTGAIVSQTTTSAPMVDMASCSAPSSTTVRVDLPQGRYAAGDQFTVTLSGNGVTAGAAGNTGTTAGTDTGLQTDAGEQGGPVLTTRGATYTITQSAAGTTIPATYVTTWQCVRAGTSTVLASGTGSTGTVTTPATAADVVCTFTNLPQRPGIDLVKSGGSIADLDGNGPDAGDTIAYAFKVTNTGAVALDPVTVRDPRVGPVTCPTGPLAPGASRTCSTVTYALTQADVDAGSVLNTATAQGTTAAGPVVRDTDAVTTPIAGRAGIQLDKSVGRTVDANRTGREDAGDTLTYSFKVTNTGTVSLNPVTVSDPKVGTVTCPSGALAPGASRTCTAAAYVLTRDDVAAGTVVNRAVATGRPPTGASVSDDDTQRVTIPQYASIQLDKRAGGVVDTDGNGVDPGDTIAYSFVVTNTGTVPLSPVTVSDPRLTSVTCPSGPLAAGDSLTCTAPAYALTQADLDAGSVVNTATAEGTPPSGTSVKDSDTVTVPVAQRAALRLDKRSAGVVDANGDGLDSAGDTIAYGFKVTNTGTVSVSDLAVSDPAVGPIACPSGTLAPGASVDCSPATHVLTADDVVAGRVVNTATASAAGIGGTRVSDDDTATTPVVRTPRLVLDKTASPVYDASGDGDQGVGDTIAYAFTVTNTGNLPLDPVTLRDPLLGPLSCPAGPLAPGAQVACDGATYTITAADVARGRVDNTATATGRPPVGADVAASDSTRTPIVSTTADLVVTKRADRASARPGERVVYTLAVRNAGPGAARDVVLRDPLPSGVSLEEVRDGGATCDVAGTPATVSCALGTLAAGASAQVQVVVVVRSPAVGAAAVPHEIDVQKAEAQLDLEPGQTRSLDVVCPTGYRVTDGSGRVDAVDQGTGTLASVAVTESRAVGADTWRVTAVNGATGRAQAKAFAVCVAEETAEAAGHRHALVVTPVPARTVDLEGGAEVDLVCPATAVPIAPGHRLEGGVVPVASRPDGVSGWRFSVPAGAPTGAQGTFTLDCLERRTAEAAGHTHPLTIGALRTTARVQPGEIAEVQLSCPDDASGAGGKGIVAGYDLPRGLVSLGSDPRPKTRAFKVVNTTDQTLEGTVHLLCLTARTGDGGPADSVRNVASATTSSVTANPGDDADAADVTVDASPTPAVPVAPRIVVGASPRVVAAGVRCSGVRACRGTAVVVAARTQRLDGHLVRRGTVLARASYRLTAGRTTTLRLAATRAGRLAFASDDLTRAVLRLSTRGRDVAVTVRR